MDGQLWWFHHDSGGHERIPRAHHRAAVAHGERQQRVWPRLEGRYCSNVLRKTDSNAERYSDGNTYDDSNTDTDCNRNSNIYADGYSDCNADRDGDSDCYTYFDTETVTDAESRANAEAASYAATAAVTSSCNHGCSLLRT